MYSEALRILDENTVKYMVDGLQGENKELKEENTELKNKTEELEGKNIQLESKTTELEEKIIDFKRKQLESDRKIIMNMNNSGFSVDQIVDVTGKTEAEVEGIIQKENFES